jgi:hypothetical protein
MRSPVMTCMAVRRTAFLQNAYGPAIHVFLLSERLEDVDARHKAGQDA